MIDGRRRRKSREQYAKLAELLSNGEAVCASLEQAGWSKKQAAKGWQSVPPVVMKMLPPPMLRLIELGKKASPEDRKNLVLGRLIDNVTNGTDKGAMSAKILGSEKEIGMWTPDQLTGVIVLGNLPQAIQTQNLLKVPEDL